MQSDPVVVVGSLVVDIVTQLPRWPQLGETMLGLQLDVFPGGKGLNQAVAAARQGSRVTFVGQVGNDVFGTILRNAVQSEGIANSYIRIASDEGSGVGLPFVFPNGENAIILLPRANMSLSAKHIREARSALELSRILLLQFEIPDDACREAARMVYGPGHTVILDPAPFRVLDPDLMEHVNILTPNQTELELLTGLSLPTPEAAMAAAPIILRRYPRLDALVATLGDQGTVVATAGRVVRIAPATVRAVDSTAAGDAFNGALAARLLQGDDIETACRFASVAGALAATRLGALPSLPTANDVERELFRMAQAMEGPGRRAKSGVKPR